MTRQTSQAEAVDVGAPKDESAPRYLVNQNWKVWYPPEDQDDWDRAAQVLEGVDLVAHVEARGSYAERNERAATIAAIPEILRIIGNANDRTRDAVERAIAKHRVSG